MCCTHVLTGMCRSCDRLLHLPCIVAWLKPSLLRDQVSRAILKTAWTRERSRQVWTPSSIRTVQSAAQPHEHREVHLLSVVAEQCSCESKKCGGQKMKSMLTHGEK